MVKYEIEIPKGSTANVILALEQFQYILIRKKDNDMNIIKPDGLSTGKFILDAGEYLITVHSEIDN